MDARLVALPLACLASLLAACATPVAEAVSEALDRDTGTTVTHLSTPVELLATTPRERDADPFAYLAPFETNRMGERHAWLWVASPADAAAPPLVRCGALSSSLSGPQPAAQAFGLTRLPYRAPAAWSIVHVMPIDAPWLDCLASGAPLEIVIGVDSFASDGRRRGDLAAFAERIR